MPEDKALNGLIGEIYNSVLDEENWQRVLHRMLSLFDAPSGLLVSHRVGVSQVGIAVFSGLPDESQVAYSNHYVGIDPYAEVLDREPIGTILVGRAMIPETGLVRTEFYNDFMRPIRMIDCLGGFLLRREDWIIKLGLHRYDCNPRFDHPDVELFKLFVPHLQRAIEVSENLHTLQSEHAAAMELLERFPGGVLLINDRCEVAYVNRRAGSLLTACKGLCVQSRRLRAADLAIQRDLDRLLGQAVETGKGLGTGSGGRLILNSPDDSPIVLTISPISGATNPFGLPRQRICAVVLLNNMQESKAAGANVLAAIYGLTPAEQRVLDGLLQGLSAKEIADRNGISFHTVRAQMKSLFGKTGVNRYGELIRMAAQAGSLVNPNDVVEPSGP